MLDPQRGILAIPRVNQSAKSSREILAAIRDDHKTVDPQKGSLSPLEEIKVPNP